MKSPKGAFSNGHHFNLANKLIKDCFNYLQVRINSKYLSRQRSGNIKCPFVTFETCEDELPPVLGRSEDCVLLNYPCITFRMVTLDSQMSN